MKYYISGIDTDSGKTIVTGLMARYLKSKHKNVITQKMVQTGCQNISEDIEMHRRIMGTPLLEEDTKGITCSYLFELPASPHLSAEREGVLIQTDKITEASNYLSKKYDILLIEGAGGLMVPLNSNTLLIDYIQEQGSPLILVSSSKLGSINHTLLSLEVIKNRGIELVGLIYNHFPNDNPIIIKDSENILKGYLKQYYPNAPFISVPKIDLNCIENINFEEIF